MTTTTTTTKTNTKTKTKAKVWILAILGLLLVIGTLAGIKVSQIRAMIQMGKTFVPPPEAVTSADVESAVWESRRTAIGSLIAVHDVTLGAELPGIIRAVGFDSGKDLKRGAMLVKLDTTNEEAQLASATADAALAKATLDRAAALRRGGANTPADLEAAEARAKQTQAVIANLQATIVKKTIRAPFDGRVAIRQVEKGQVVSPGTPIATLQSVDPIYAEFALPQQALANLKTGQSVTVRVDSFPTLKWEGTISVVNSEVDTTTRNIRVRATLPNKDGLLRPGLFVNVDVHSDDKHPVLIIPATAIAYAPFGDSVFVLEKDGDKAEAKPGDADGAKKPPAGPPQEVLAVQPRFVRLGERRGDLVAVVSGLKAGERIVSNGVFKLRKGMHVVLKNELAPNANLDPRPTDQ